MFTALLESAPRGTPTSLTAFTDSLMSVYVPTGRRRPKTGSFAKLAELLSIGPIDREASCARERSGVLLAQATLPEPRRSGGDRSEERRVGKECSCGAWLGRMEKM